MWFRKAVASNGGWRTTKILESIDRPMSVIKLKLLWTTKDAQSLFGTLIKTKDRTEQVQVEYTGSCRLGENRCSLHL